MSKKLVIPKEQFSEVDAYTGNLFIRYRLASEDKNRVSAWSPIYEVDPQAEFVPGSLTTAGNVVGIKGTGYLTLAWDKTTVYSYSTGSYIEIGELPSYDVWIQYGDNNMVNAGPWTHQGRISSTSVNVILPSTYSYVNSSGVTQTAVPKQAKVEIHRPVRPVIRYSPNRISFPQDSRYIDLVNDTISFTSMHGLTTGDHIAYYVYNSASAITPLSDGATYYVRALSDTSISLHPSLSDAVNNTNKVNITAAGQGNGIFVKNPFNQSTAISVTTNVITLPTPHGFSTGDGVIYNSGTLPTTNAPSIAKETLYFVRVLSPTTVTLHRTKAGAINNTNIIDFTNVTGASWATFAVLPSLLYKTSITSL